MNQPEGPISIRLEARVPGSASKLKRKMIKNVELSDEEGDYVGREGLMQN